MLHPVIVTNIEALRDICEKYHVEKLFAFGSVLKEDLECLFHRKVDLINEKYVKNPYVINGIEKTRTSLYAEQG